MTESSTLEHISKLEDIQGSLDKGNPAYQTVEQQLTDLRLSLPQTPPLIS